MIESFVKVWDEHKGELRERFAQEHPGSYFDIVKSVVAMLHDSLEGCRKPDPERVHEIDDGHYQGTLVFVIGEGGYQPHEYWYVRVWYGSCSGCDTLQSIQGYAGGKPGKQQVNDYMTLALHILQGLKPMGGEGAD